MSVYLGNNLLAGAIDAANQDGSNITNSFSSNLVTKMSDTANSYMAGLGMPSTTYENLTLGASGTSYTAPADGWYAISKVGATGTNVTMATSYYGTRIVANANNFNMIDCLPVKKGETVQVFYTAAGTTNYFRFIYAVGSESEYTPTP